jgi:hypothetical protein
MASVVEAVVPSRASTARRKSLSIARTPILTQPHCSRLPGDFLEMQNFPVPACITEARSIFSASKSKVAPMRLKLTTGMHGGNE